MVDFNRKKLVDISLTIEEQDLLISLLRSQHFHSDSKNFNPILNRFLGRFSRLVFNNPDDLLINKKGVMGSPLLITSGLLRHGVLNRD